MNEQTKKILIGVVAVVALALAVTMGVRSMSEPQLETGVQHAAPADGKSGKQREMEQMRANQGSGGAREERDLGGPL